MEGHPIGRLLGAILLAPAILFCGPARGELHALVGSDLVDLLERAGPQPRLLDEPAVVSDATQRQVVPRLCEAVGEAALGRLAETAAVEEAFAFIPQTCTWIDIGVDQTPSSVRVERRVIDELAATFGRVIVYHIHPRTSDRRASYLPAFSDLLAVVLINSRYSGDRSVHILHRAVTPDEIYEYTFDPAEDGMAMLDAIFGTGLGDFAGENLQLHYGAAARADEYHQAVRDCVARSGETTWPEACFPMRAGDFVLERRARAAGALPGPEM